MKNLEIWNMPLFSTAIVSQSITNSESEEAVRLQKQINRLKEDVIANPGKAYYENEDIVHPEVIRSWQRSFQNGLLPTDDFWGPPLDKVTFEGILEDKHQLMDVSSFYIGGLRQIMSQIPCLINLFDENGVNLYTDTIGDLSNEELARNHMQVGQVWNEGTIGTCTHALSLILKCPVQLWGTEHYLNRWRSSVVGVSAPIFDPFGNLTAVLQVANHGSHYFNPHTLTTLTALAWAIENQMKWATESELLQTNMNSTQLGVIVLNRNGVVVHINSIAEKIVAGENEAFHQKSLIGQKVSSIFPADKIFLKLFAVTERTETDFYWNNARYQIAVTPYKGANGQLGYTIQLREDIAVGHPHQPDANKPQLYTFGRIIGHSQELTRALRLAQQFATTPMNILLSGENGTGKDIIAQAIHSSSRSHGPFVAINCGAIPRNLIESELFGYEKNAFTGADKKGRRGKFEMAEGGTLFLDEIGDMPLELQPVLLRVLENKKVTRVGGDKEIDVNFRLISATNKNLSELTKQGLFREDLYYRLSSCQISIPPLRLRSGDPLELAAHFIKKESAKLGKQVSSYDGEVKTMLQSYSWPGNIRQLQNAVSFAVNVCDGSELGLMDFPDDLVADYRRPAAPPTDTVQTNDSIASILLTGRAANPAAPRTMEDVEKEAIREALRETNYNIRKTREILNMSKSTLYRRMKKYGYLISRNDNSEQE